MILGSKNVKRAGQLYVFKKLYINNIIYKKTVLEFFEINEKKSFLFYPLPCPSAHYYFF
jgi:hypothetical protein